MSANSEAVMLSRWCWREEAVVVEMGSNNYKMEVLIDSIAVPLLNYSKTSKLV